MDILAPPGETARFVFSPSAYAGHQPRGVLPFPSACARVRSRSPPVNQQQLHNRVVGPRVGTIDLKHNFDRIVEQYGECMAEQFRETFESPENGLSCAPHTSDEEASEDDVKTSHFGGEASGFLLRPKSKPGKRKKAQPKVPSQLLEVRAERTDADEVQSEPRAVHAGVWTCPSCTQMFPTTTCPTVGLRCEVIGCD